jgi:hypothetical protein
MDHVSVAAHTSGFNTGSDNQNKWWLFPLHSACPRSLLRGARAVTARAGVPRGPEGGTGQSVSWTRHWRLEGGVCIQSEPTGPEPSALATGHSFSAGSPGQPSRWGVTPRLLLASPPALLVLEVLGWTPGIRAVPLSRSPALPPQESTNRTPPKWWQEEI